MDTNKIVRYNDSFCPICNMQNWKVYAALVQGNTPGAISCWLQVQYYCKNDEYYFIDEMTIDIRGLSEFGEIGTKVLLQ